MRIQCRTILASAVAALAAVSSFAGTISFTPGNTEIAVAAQAPGPVKLAALEMKDVLSRVLGTPVPIVNKIDPAKATIILGTNEWSKAAGIDVSSLKTDGYIHKTSGNRLYIAGMDSSHSIDHCVWSRFFKRGTLMGTYAFLEKYAGCRFYFPGELGEIAPRKASVDVPALDFRDAPAMADRKYGYHQCGK